MELFNKLLLVILTIFIPLSGTISAIIEDDDVITDQQCLMFIATYDEPFDADGKPKCNGTCRKVCIDEGDYCLYGEPEGACQTGPLENLGIKKLFNFLGYNLSADQAVLIFIRMGLYLVFGAAALVAIVYGIMGMYKWSSSQGTPDKIEEATKIFKNAVIGFLIIFVSVFIVQIVYMLLGLTGNVFDFNFIPRSGKKIIVSEADIGRPCYPEQEDTGGAHSCIDGVWK